MEKTAGLTLPEIWLINVITASVNFIYFSLAVTALKNIAAEQKYIL